MSIRTMIVDDHPDIRVLLRMIIERAGGDLEVACEAASGSEALAIVHRCDPTVIVLDEMMPGMNGVETCTRIMEERPGQVVILFSAYLDDDVASRAHAAGVAATVHKDHVRSLPGVIRDVALV